MSRVERLKETAVIVREVEVVSVYQLGKRGKASMTREGRVGFRFAQEVDMQISLGRQLGDESGLVLSRTAAGSDPQAEYQ